jgi:L-histidine N-alpha-methyltransferase
VLDFARSVVRTASAPPRTVDCRFLYDAEGSRLFERICETPEYYLTRTEAGILQRSAAEIARLTGPGTVVELGSGSARKTAWLLNAYTCAYGPVCYVPVDVSEHALIDGAVWLSAGNRHLSIHGLQASYEDAFPLLEQFSPLVLLFLGSTIGNLDEAEAARFWSRLVTALTPGDFVLLGVDLVKPKSMIDAAYNDKAGWSAAFTRNVFARMNRELGSDIDLNAIRHEAFYQPQSARVEIYARFVSRQVVAVRPLEEFFTVPAGERVMTEISRKFEPRGLVHYLARFGLETVQRLSDPERRYGVILSRLS